MGKSIVDLSPEDLEKLIENAVDKRLDVWFTQLVDALAGSQESESKLKPEFAAALKKSLGQADAGEGVSIEQLYILKVGHRREIYE